VHIILHEKGCHNKNWCHNTQTPNNIGAIISWLRPEYSPAGRKIGNIEYVLIFSDPNFSTKMFAITHKNLCHDIQRPEKLVVIKGGIKNVSHDTQTPNNIGAIISWLRPEYSPAKK
jgi:hypothetical protein